MLLGKVLDIESLLDSIEAGGAGAEVTPMQVLFDMLLKVRKHYLNGFGLCIFAT
jgi:hypothetical protein